ncbi:MAG: DUF1636 domain-containing protein [Rhodobiaceae bacterium]|nr:DUF1636 domain-containing protein [Rhodobiaceae bacterium]
MTTITICTTCRRDKTNEDPLRDGTRFLNIVDRCVREAAPDGSIRVRGMACMSSCKRACAAQIAGDGRFTYVLAELDPTRDDAEALIAFARTHAEKENGLVIKSERPESIKDNVVARVAPPDFNAFPLVDDWQRIDED